MLHYMIEKLCGRIDEFKKSGQPMPMRQVYMCLTTDIITLYALNRSWNHLDSPDFSPFWVETIKATSGAGHFLKQFPFMYGVIRALPHSVVGAMNPGMLMLLKFQQVSYSLIYPTTTRKFYAAAHLSRKYKKKLKKSLTDTINPARLNLTSVLTRQSSTPFWNLTFQPKRRNNRDYGRKVKSSLVQVPIPLRTL